MTLAGVTLAPDEVEIQATPRPGHRGRRTTRASSWSSTPTLTPELRAEGDARELQRAIQDLRKEAGLELDDRIDLWVDGARRRRSAVHLPAVAAETLADLAAGAPPAGAARRPTVDARRRRR